MPTKIFPAYLFLGEEDFLKEEAIEKLKSRLFETNTRAFVYSIFYGREKDFSIHGLLDSLNTVPFLSKKRLVILKDADLLLAGQNKFVISYLKNPRQSSVFIIESSLPSIKGGFLLEASSLARLVYFRRLTGPAVNAWLNNKAAQFKKRISPEAVNVIKENLSNDLRSLSSGMEKLILYTGKRTLITKEDAESLTGVNLSHSAFDLMSSIEKKDVKKALNIFSSLKKNRKKETELLGLLAWNIRMVLRLKELSMVKDKIDICRVLGLNPRAFDRIGRHASSFKKSQVLILLDEILKADLDIKTGTLPDLVIERLIVRVCT